MIVRTSELDYDLPEGVIATRAAEPRDSARMLVLRRSDPAFLAHATVRDLPSYLTAADTLVFNRTRVLAARLIAINTTTGGKVEGLFLHESASHPGHWRVLIKARRARPGSVLTLLDTDDHPSDVVLTLLERAEDEEGGWLASVTSRGSPVEPGASPSILARVGRTPLPPYILAARRAHGEGVPDRADRERYQTVYASEQSGSVAAPTAGLHFTPGLLDKLERAGVRSEEVVLHVGTGTFRPVETESLLDHPMHREWCSMSPETCERIAATRRPGAPARVIAIGTTTVRTLESYASWVDRLSEPTEHAGSDRLSEPMQRSGKVRLSEPTEHAGSDRLSEPSDSPDDGHRSPARSEPWPSSIDTRLLITPGHRFRWVDGMLTNFHLPRSTLLALVAAALELPTDPGSGIRRVKEAYAIAIREGFRFYSYGDAMLILP